MPKLYHLHEEDSGPSKVQPKICPPASGIPRSHSGAFLKGSRAQLAYMEHNGSGVACMDTKSAEQPAHSQGLVLHKESDDGGKAAGTNAACTPSGENSGVELTGNAATTPSVPDSGHTPYGAPSSQDKLQCRECGANETTCWRTGPEGNFKQTSQLSISSRTESHPQARQEASEPFAQAIIAEQICMAATGWVLEEVIAAHYACSPHFLTALLFTNAHGLKGPACLPIASRHACT